MSVTDSKGRTFYQVHRVDKVLYVGRQSVLIENIRSILHPNFRLKNSLESEELPPKEGLNRLVRICTDAIDPSVSVGMNGFFVHAFGADLEREPNLVNNDYVGSCTLYYATLQFCSYLARSSSIKTDKASKQINPSSKPPLLGEIGLNGTNMII